MSLSKFLYVVPNDGTPRTFIGTPAEFKKLLESVPGSGVVCQLTTNEETDIDRHAMLARSRADCPYPNKWECEREYARWMETFGLFEKFEQEANVPVPATPVRVAPDG